MPRVLQGLDDTIRFAGLVPPLVPSLLSFFPKTPEVIRLLWHLWKCRESVSDPRTVNRLASPGLLFPVTAFLPLTEGKREVTESRGQNVFPAQSPAPWE